MLKMTIIRDAQEIIETTYEREFIWRDNPDAGFSFPCDQEGNLINPNEVSLDKYQKCIKGEYDVIDKGIVKYTRRYRQPAVLLCSCGLEVELRRFTNTCDCGADYNFAGSLLAPREQWGEETGETWMECY
jgi:hypothetical protein